MYFGLLSAVGAYAAFLSWAPLIVRAIRGEPVREDWRLLTGIAAAMASYAVKSGAQIRQAEALRQAVIGPREVQRDAAEDSKRRDERAAKLQEGLNRFTRRLVLIAALTLGASIVAVAVAIVTLVVS